MSEYWDERDKKWKKKKHKVRSTYGKMKPEQAEDLEKRVKSIEDLRKKIKALDRGKL